MTDSFREHKTMCSPHLKHKDAMQKIGSIKDNPHQYLEIMNEKVEVQSEFFRCQNNS